MENQTLMEPGGAPSPADTAITIVFATDATPAQIYAAVIDPRAWWSEEITGVTDQLGAEWDYHYQDIHRARFRVTDLVPGRRVEWLVIDNHFNFTRDPQEWRGTRPTFDIVPVAGRTELRFTHVGLTPAHECYEVCDDAWAGFIRGSLKHLITTGRGQPARS